MRNHIIIYFFMMAFFFSGLTANAQLHVAFAEMREFPQDSAAYKQLEALFLAQKVSQARKLGLRKADSCLNAGNKHDYMFFMNQTGAYTFFIGKDLKKTFATFHAIDSVMQGHNDTLSIEFAITQKFLATTYFYQYNDKKANVHYRRGLTIAKKLGMTDNTLAADFYVNIGNSYTNMGLYEKALPYTRKGRQLAKNNGYYHLLMLANQTYGYIASYRDKQLAFEFYAHIFEEAKRLSNHLAASPEEKANFMKYRANIDNVVTSLYLNDKEYDKALFHAERAYDTFKKANLPDPYLYILITTTIAKLHTLKGQPAQTRKYVAEALQVVDNSFGRQDPRALKVLNSGLQYGLQTGNMDTAAHYAQAMQAVNLERAARSEKITYYLGLADYSIANNNTDKAKAYYLQAIRLYAPDFELENISQTTPGMAISHEDFFKNLHKVLADFQGHFDEMRFAETREKDLRRKLAYYNFMTAQLDKHATGIILEQSGLEYSRKFQHTANRQIKTATGLYRITGKQEDFDGLYAAVAKTKSFFLQKQMAINHINAQNAKNSQKWQAYVHALQKLKNLENKQRVSELAGRASLSDSLEAEVLDIKFSIMQQKMAIEEEGDVSLPIIPHYKVTELQALLRSGEALLNYYMTDSALLAFCITQDQVAFSRSDDLQNLETRLRGYYRAIKTGDHRLDEKSAPLSGLLLEPFREILADKKHLVFIPHKDLFKVPMEPLLLENGSQLIEEKSVSYHYSSYLWASARGKQRPEEANLLAFAPVFSEETASDQGQSYRWLADAFIKKYYRNDQNKLETLGHSYDEVSSIKRAFEEKSIGTRVFTYKDATEKNFKRYAPEASIIHLATHGYVSEEDPGLSGFFFEKGEHAQEDGYLFSGEIYNLGLQTGLVVLSTCNSGSGKIDESEGILSLTRNFVYTGVPDIVSSLWKVDDKNTKKLMVKFYSHYLQGKPYPKALQQAKLDCMKEGMLPLDWASFVLVGR